jgi:hypothetical protein
MAKDLRTGGGGDAEVSALGPAGSSEGGALPSVWSDAVDPFTRRGAVALGPKAGGPGRCYVGQRTAGGCRVSVLDAEGPHPLKSRRPDPLWSFAWGRAGSSARELAWSILYDCAGDAGLADDWCAVFATEVISHLSQDGFALELGDVLTWLYEDRLEGGTRAPRKNMQPSALSARRAEPQRRSPEHGHQARGNT